MIRVSYCFFAWRAVAKGEKAAVVATTRPYQSFLVIFLQTFFIQLIAVSFVGCSFWSGWISGFTASSTDFSWLSG
jgi:hypothetical protein